MVPSPVTERGRGRGVAIGLAGVLLCSGVAVAALPSGPDRRLDEEVQWKALAITPASKGARTGIRLTAASSVEPIPEAPERARLDLQLTYSGTEPFGAMLIRAGAAYSDASQAHALIGKVAPGTRVHLVLGPRQDPGRTILAAEMSGGLDRKLRLGRGEGGTLQLIAEQIAVDTTPRRISGRAGGGLYWALRSAGASPQVAAEYLKALAGQIDVGGDIGPADMFDLVLAHRASATGESREGPLLYAGINRHGQRAIQLVRWRSGNSLSWIDANALDRPAEESAMTWPVAGRITSNFGTRVHPILRFRRFHRGIDFGAPSGTPIHASASGQVTAAGWAGGYGRQVRISHGGGVATTYSHMSAIAAEPGSFVRQGQVIGYVGSSGMSTGAHLHYEVYVSGQPVDPLGVKLSAPTPVNTAQVNAVRARLKALLRIGTKKA
jgi:murein DD-endopeptidase MepM/ murein hydrolase activator NlpD